MAFFRTSFDHANRANCRAGPAPPSARSAIVAVAATCIVLASTAPAKTIYVDDDATGLNNGTSWQDAYTFLQDALAAASWIDKPVEIRVAQGTYKPDQGGNQIPPGARHASFNLISGVAIKGGYAGLGAVDPNARDIVQYETILSGDLAGNDVDVADLRDLLDEPTRAENSFHVVVGSGTDPTAVLDGFTITGGNADGSDPWPYARWRGGGMYNNQGSPTVVDCRFVANSAAGRGGGGGMHNIRSSVTMSGCTFIGNAASIDGGGLCNSTLSDASLSNCRFIRNWARYGGAMSTGPEGNLILINCAFIRNSAEFGGGARNFGDTHAKFVNCLFAGNSASYGKAISCLGGVMEGPSSPSTVELGNCILWDGGGEISSVGDSAITITYSDVQGGWAGEGNIDIDPRFVDPNRDCYHLKSQAGRWDIETKTWFTDDVTSPCIDAGDPMSSIGHEPFPNGGIVNMGAYGGTPEASKSYFGEPVCETIMAGDLNGDCRVDFVDLGLLGLHWLEDNTPVNSNSIITYGTEYYIETNKPVYHLGEEVRILYRVRNMTHSPIEIGTVPNCEYAWSHFVITDNNGIEIWEYLRGPPPCGHKMLRLDAYESKELQKDWNMTNDNGTFWPEDDHPVTAGRYKVTGELKLSGGYERVPISVYIAVTP